MRTITVLIAALAFTATADAGTWRQHPGPVLIATQGWEDQAVQEPTVIYDHGVYKMWYSGGYSDHNALGYATSKNGLSWRKHTGPVLGQGGSNYPGNVAHSSVTKYAGVFYAYFCHDSRASPDPDTHVATSTDGIHWNVALQPVLMAGAWHNTNTNTAVWHDRRGWHMLFDFMHNATGYWETGIANSHNPFHFHADPFGPLYTLKPTPDQNTFGGPSLIKTRDGFDLYYIASTGPWNIPSLVYQAHTTDPRMHQWTPDPIPVLTFEQPWQVDQVADPSVVIAHGRSLMFFDGLDNTDLVKFKASIGIATYRP